MLKPISQTRVHSDIQARLKEYFVKSGLRPNDQLPSEHELSKKLGTSRSAVREALRSLEALGLIEVRRGKGRYLRKFSFEPITDHLAYSLILDATSIRDLLDVRRALEISFLRQAAASLTDQDLANLLDIVRHMQAKAEVEKSFVEEDMAFHKTLFSRVRNTLLQKLLDTFWSLFQAVHSKGVLPPGKTIQMVAYHRKIVDAIAARDLKTAEALLIEHFADVEGRLRSAEDLIASDSTWRELNKTFGWNDDPSGE